MKTTTPGVTISNVSAIVLNCIETLAASSTPATMDRCLPDLAQAAEQLRTLQACLHDESAFGPVQDLRHNIAVLKALLHHAAEFYQHRARYHGQSMGGYHPAAATSALLFDPTVIVES